MPNRILVAMRILKEECGCNDENLYEQCRFNLLFRVALGMFHLNNQCPSITTYYGFCRVLTKYNDEHQKDLFGKCFKQITREQAKEYRIS